MHPALQEIPSRIFRLAEGALAQANTHAVYLDPGQEYWDFMSMRGTRANFLSKRL